MVCLIPQTPYPDPVRDLGQLVIFRLKRLPQQQFREDDVFVCRSGPLPAACHFYRDWRFRCNSGKSVTWQAGRRSANPADRADAPFLRIPCFLPPLRAPWNGFCINRKTVLRDAEMFRFFIILPENPVSDRCRKATSPRVDLHHDSPTFERSPHFPVPEKNSPFPARVGAVCPRPLLFGSLSPGGRLGLRTFVLQSLRQPRLHDRFGSTNSLGLPAGIRQSRPALPNLGGMALE